MLIAVGGKKGSGKSTLSKILIQHGFIEGSYAEELKKYLAKIYDWDINDLYDPVKKEERLFYPVEWNNDTATELEQLAEIPYYQLNRYTEWFNTRRYAMQYVGTDILRSYDTDFHVKKFLQKFNPSQNVVIQDVRFTNELLPVKETNGVSIYIERPDNDAKAGEHSSENSLSKTDFDYCIINDGSKVDFEHKIYKLLKEITVFGYV